MAWIDTLSQFIRDCYAADIKLIGICFGHQILAQALGGRVEKSEKGRGFGEKPFAISHKKEWMGDYTPDECKLYFAHDDQVMTEGNMDEAMYKTAVSSLKNANPDRAIAGRWIHNFLKG